MNKSAYSIFFLLIILASGCTQSSSNQRQSTTDAQEAAVLNLSILATDNLEIKRSTLFSGEMTRLSLNLINLAEVYFNDIRAILINADDLNPTIEYDYIEFIQPNRSNTFEWELTAPRLGVGEALILNDIKVRTYYETYSTALKTILLKTPGDRSYISTYSESSKSPIKLYFDTSYESVTTLDNNEIKNFTVNLVLYNEYTGIVDYFNNSYYADNYIKYLIIGVPKELIFYDYTDLNSPWINATGTPSEIERFSIEQDSMNYYDYYYVEFKKIEEYGSQYNFLDLCNLLTKTNEQSISSDISSLIEQTTLQKRVLWMTKGFTKINVLRFGAKTVEFDSELNLKARIEYSYSQDFGGNGFGAIIYGTG
ncbi:MAG: hypothetical protein PHN56_00965 [Candidatus Nanoarchaeia archaeon]|nr:hypothetical protein [Candidatus Nanoarchaeia archaeon]